MPIKTFAEVFCSCYDCPRESFVEEVLFRCLYPHARRWMRIFHFLGTHAALEASALVDAAGNTRSKEELKELVSLYHNNIKPSSGIWVRKFKIRVSCERLLMLHSQVRKNEAQNHVLS